MRRQSNPLLHADYRDDSWCHLCPDRYLLPIHRGVRYHVVDDLDTVAVGVVKISMSAQERNVAFVEYLTSSTPRAFMIATERSKSSAYDEGVMVQSLPGRLGFTWWGIFASTKWLPPHSMNA
jgi:hypothetical protein